MIDRSIVGEGMMAHLAEGLAFRLKTSVRVHRRERGKGWSYSIVFPERPGINAIVNRNGLSVEETKRLLALLCDMFDHCVIGPGVRK